MTSRPTTSKLLLVAQGRTAAESGRTVPVRRFRLARIVAGDHADAAKGAASHRD